MQRLFLTVAIIGLLICGQKMFLTPKPSATGGAALLNQSVTGPLKLADESTRRLRRAGFDYLQSARAHSRTGPGRVC